jgi:hypothetical protein
MLFFMEQGATFLAFWPSITFHSDQWVVREEVRVAKMAAVVLLMSSSSAFWAPLSPLSSILLFLAGVQEQTYKDGHMKDPLCWGKHEGLVMERRDQCERASFCSSYFMCISQEKDAPFQEPETTQDSETDWRQMASSGGPLWAQVDLLL